MRRRWQIVIENYVVKPLTLIPKLKLTERSIISLYFIHQIRSLFYSFQITFTLTWLTLPSVFSQMVWNHTSRLLSNFPQTKTFSQSPRALQRQKWPKTIPSIVLTFCTKILYPAKLYWRWKHSHHCMLNSMQELCGLDFYRFLLLLFSLFLFLFLSLSFDGIPTFFRSV